MSNASSPVFVWAFPDSNSEAHVRAALIASCLVDVGAKRRKFFALISGFQLDFRRVALYFNRGTKGL
jgi:hypothetical protein